MTKIGLFSLIGAALAVIFIVGCGGDKESSQNQNTKKVAVKGEIVVSSDFQLTRNFTGTIEGARQAIMTAKISEAVEDVPVKEGDFVESDQILSRLDRTGPTSNYIQAFSLFQNAEKNYKKMKYLFKEGAVSETQFDATRTEYEVAKANYDAARQTVDIKSPIAGMVTSIDVSIGDYLYPGKIVATVASIDKLRMKLGVSSAEINLFETGNDVNVYVESASKLEAKGSVAKIARSADPETRTFTVEIAIDNPDHNLKPGMFGRAEITAKRLENVIAVPRNSVIAAAEGNYVFVIAGEKVRRKKVDLGVDFNGRVEIKEGLNPGDTLVTVGQNYLTDGSPIKLVRLVNDRGEEIEL